MDDPFYGTSGPRDADIVVVGEAWGAMEARNCEPFVGESGQELTRILAEAGINRKDCLLTNVVAERPHNNDITKFLYPTAVGNKEKMQLRGGLYPRATMTNGVKRLGQELAAYPRKLVIGCGNFPLWALTEDNYGITYKGGFRLPTGIGTWRGSQLYTRADMGALPFLPVYHPAAILRQWAWRRILVHDLRLRTPLARAGNWRAPKVNFVVRPSLSEVLHWIDRILQSLVDKPRKITVDLETRNELIACLGMASSDRDALCIPFMEVGRGSYWPIEEEVQIWRALRKLLLHPNIQVVGQNFLYDLQYLNRWLFMRPKTYMDTMITHHLCFPGTPKGLDHLSSLYCQYHRYWKDEGKNWDASINEEQLWIYNCKDAIATYEVSDVLEDLVEKFGLVEQNKIQTRQIPMVTSMMIRGVSIDEERRQELIKETEAAIADHERLLEYVLPPHIYPRKKKAKPWYSSPKQQMEVFYDILCCKEVLNHKTKNRTVDDDALHQIMKKEPALRPLCEAILEFRSLRVFLTSFLLKPVDPDGRMRCSYNIAGTETFRYTSDENAWGRGGNLQNIPKGTEDK